MYDEASELVEVLGTAPDGCGQTVYVVEPHGTGVFADHRCPFAPTAWALDHNAGLPERRNRGQLLAFGPTGTTAAARHRATTRSPGGCRA